MNTRMIATIMPLILLTTACAHVDGRQYETSGAASKQAAAYRHQLEVNPADTSARLGYATALSRQGKYRAAEKQFIALLEQQPGNVEALSGMGYNYVWSDRYELAEQQFRAALDKTPNDYDLKKGLAFTYLQSGRALQALEALESLRLEHPDDLEVLAAIESAEVSVIAIENRADQ